MKQIAFEEGIYASQREGREDSWEKLIEYLCDVSNGEE